MQFVLLQSTTSSSDFLTMAAIGMLLWGLLVSYIISTSTKQKQHIKNEQAQIALLTHIAMKLGVDPKDVNETIKDL